MQELQCHVTPENTQVLPFLDHINSLLHQALVTCKATTQVKPSTVGHPLVQKENIAPGKSVEHQWRFKKTAKSPGRKKHGIVLRQEK